MVKVNDPHIEIAVEEVPLPPVFEISSETRSLSVTSKDYSTVTNTWGFTILSSEDGSLSDIIREDFADGVSFQTIPLANDVIAFAQSDDGQSIITIDKYFTANAIRRNKETSHEIFLLPELKTALQLNPVRCLSSHGGLIAISNDSRQVLFHIGSNEVFVYVQRSHHLPSWINLNLGWPQEFITGLQNAGHTLAHKFIQTELASTILFISSSFYSTSQKTGKPVLVVSSFLIRPLLDQTHFLSRPQCEEVKNFKFIYSLGMFGSELTPNYQPGSLILSLSHSGNILALAVNQNHTAKALSNSRLLFFSTHMQAVVTCKLDSLLEGENDFVTSIEWIRNDLICGVCAAKGNFGIYAVASGALRLILSTTEISLSLTAKNTVEHTIDKGMAIKLMRSSAVNVFNRNTLAMHVTEPVFLCYSFAQASHVLLRNVPQRIRMIRDYCHKAEEHYNSGDFVSAGRSNLSAWGLVSTAVEPFHDKQLSIIRELSKITFNISLSFIVKKPANVDRFCDFLVEMKNLMGFSVYQDECFSFLAETATLCLLMAFDHLLPTNTSEKVKNPTPAMLLKLFRIVSILDEEIRSCHRYLDSTTYDVRNLYFAVDQPEHLRSKRNKTSRDTFPALTWALNFHERLYLEICRQVLTEADESKRSIKLTKYKPLLQKIQAACALVCPVETCVAALADFKVAPGVDHFLDGDIESALQTWSYSLEDFTECNASAETQKNMILTSLFGLMTTNRVVEAVLLCDFAILNIFCPVRRKVDFSFEADLPSLRHVARFSNIIAKIPRLGLLLGPFSHLIGSLAAMLGKWYLEEPLRIPPALQPRDVDFDPMSSTTSDHLRYVPVDTSFISTADKLGLVNPSKAMLAFLISGRYNDAIRFAKETSNYNCAVVIALAVYMFSLSARKVQDSIKPEFSPSRLVKTILDSFTKPIDSIVDFLFLISTIGSGNSTIGLSTLQDHDAVKKSLIDLTLEQIPVISDGTLVGTLLLSAVCKNKAVVKFSRSLSDIMHKCTYPLMTLFFSNLLNKDKFSQYAISQIPVPVYCTQIFDGISSEDSILSLINTRLADLHRKISADVVENFLNTLKCSKTLTVVVSYWRKQMGRVYSTWQDSLGGDVFFLTIENPELKIFRKSDETIDCEIEENSSLEALCEDFFTFLSAMALWELVDKLSTSWANYRNMLNNDTEQNSDLLQNQQDVILEGFACLLPYTLQFSAQSGKSLCFDVVIKLASQFNQSEKLARMFAFATSVLAQSYGEELLETFVNPRLEPLIDSWKGTVDKSTGSSLIFTYASEMKKFRDYFGKFNENSNFLSDFTLLLLSSSKLWKFTANLLDVRFRPNKSAAEIKSPTEMLIAENWSHVMQALLASSKSSQSENIGPKTLVSNFLSPFLPAYPDNSAFAGHLAVGQVLGLYKHANSVIQESSVWKAGVGGRTLAELERRKGDGNMAEFYQLMRPADYPEFVDEILSVCNYMSTMNFTLFEPKLGQKPKVELNFHPIVAVHVLWMREVRPNQPAEPEMAGLLVFYEEFEEGAKIKAESVESSESSEESKDKEPAPIRNIESFWQNLRSKLLPDEASSSSSHSVTTTGDLSNFAPYQHVVSSHKMAAVGSDRVESEENSSDHPEKSEENSSDQQVKSKEKLIDYLDKPVEKLRSSSTSPILIAEEPHETMAEPIDLEIPKLISGMLQHQTESIGQILNQLSQQQNDLISNMTSLIQVKKSEKSTTDSTSSISTVKKTKKSSSSSSSSSTSSTKPIPRLLTLSCPKPTKPVKVIECEPQKPRPLPKMLALSDPDDYCRHSGDEVMSEKRMVGLFKAASSFTQGSQRLPADLLAQKAPQQPEIPQLIGVGMLSRFRIRRRRIQAVAVEEKRDKTENPTKVVQAEHLAKVEIPEVTVYKSSVGVNTDKMRMVSVGISAKTTQVATETVQSRQRDEGIFDSIVVQSEKATEKRQEDFFRGPPADIGLLNYFNRRPMPPFLHPPVKIEMKEVANKVLVNSATETDEKAAIEDKMERYTTTRSGLDENLRIVNPESFAMLEDKMGLSPIKSLSGDFVSVTDIAKRDFTKRTVEDAEAQLEILMENARKTLAIKSDQRIAQTQTPEAKWVSEQTQENQALDSWQVENPEKFNSGLDLMEVGEEIAPAPLVIDNELLLNISRRLDSIDEANKSVQVEVKKLAEKSESLVVPPTVDSAMQVEEQVPPIFKKSVSFSEHSLLDSPRVVRTQRELQKKSSSSPTPTTPHLDVVQLVDTGSLQPRSPALKRTPRVFKAESTMSSTRPSEMRSTGRPRPVDKGVMNKRLDNASKLVKELIDEQVQLQSRSKERWSRPVTHKTKAMSDTEKWELSDIHDQMRHVLDLKTQTGRRVDRQKEHIDWLLEQEADLAKPPSEISDDNREQSAQHITAVDPDVAELMEKYSVHSGSVFSIVDWNQVDQMLAQEVDH